MLHLDSNFRAADPGKVVDICQEKSHTVAVLPQGQEDEHWAPDLPGLPRSVTQAPHHPLLVQSSEILRLPRKLASREMHVHDSQLVASQYLFKYLATLHLAVLSKISGTFLFRGFS